MNEVHSLFETRSDYGSKGKSEQSRTDITGGV